MSSKQQAIRIDLVSDTVTQPTTGMREAMARAAVGDEQRGEDPSTNRLCARVAELLGKEAAVFLPTGVMCNQISILVHCRPGDEIFTHDSAHIITSEAGGAAVLAGASTRGLHGPQGMFAPEDIEAVLRAPKRNALRPRLIVIEQAINRGGGSVWPVPAISGLASFAHERGMALHMDGARLFNAVIASGRAAADHAQHCDSVWVDFSKGLGAPVGAVLAGSQEFIQAAWVWKHRLGGAMRQSGVLAAAALYALDHHVQRLAQDHENARLFAERVADIEGVRVDPAQVQTNLVFLDVHGTSHSARELCDRMLQHSIRLGTDDTWRIRAVTHLDVARKDVEEAAALLRQILGV